MASAVGIGVIGLGFMGHRFARFVSQIEGVRLAGVCDVDANRAKAVGEELAVPFFQDAESLARASGVQGVIIATPEDRHVEPAVAALSNGVAVLIEKPIAHSLEAARTIERAATEAGVPAMVGHLLRFEARWIGAWQRLSAGQIGDVVSISTRRVGNVRDQDVLRGRTTIPLYYGVHDLDVMRWFAGSEATTIYAQRRAGALRVHGYDIDDVYHAVINFENGVLGAAELGWHIPPEALPARSSGVTVVGTRGFIRIEQGESGLECWTPDGLDRALDTTFWLESYGVPGGAMGLEIRHFADLIRGAAEPAITLQDAIEALRLSLAMEESATRGQPVALAEFGRVED